MGIVNGERYYQLVVTDVDGTLLDSSHRIAPGSREAFQALSLLGVQSILASGRPMPGVAPLLMELGLGPAHIGAGGAYAVGPDGKMLFEQLLPMEALPELVQRARAVGVDAALHTYEKIVMEGSDAHEKDQIRYNGVTFIERVPDVLAAGVDNPCKLTLWGDPDRLKQYMADVLPLGLPVSMAVSQVNFLEINSIKANKGNALLVLAGRLGVPLERVIAVGDQQNDVSMFRVVGLPVAMGNSPEAVKQQAKVVAPSNDEGGLAWAIQKFILHANGHPAEGI
jgi:Cof subfamily protein (haloacid dehalogenase superfamily)